jgi:hypothetical protein
VNYVDGSIDRIHLSADIIDSTKLADNSVNSEHYVDGSIDQVHLAANSVDSENYVDGSIDNAHIADNAINSEHYAAGSIDTEHIAADQITNALLANMAQSTVKGRASGAGTGDPTDLTAAQLRTIIGFSASTSYLRSDTSDIMTSGTLTFNDNVKIGFGTSNGEGTLYSNGTATYWDMGADKDLYIRDETTSRFLFDVSAGDFHADGEITAYSTSVGSDPRLKYNIEPIESALDKMNKLNGVTFNWKKNNETDAGLLSPDVMAVLPEAVKTGKLLNQGEDIQTVNYNAIVGLLVESIKELSAKVTDLESRL